MDILLGFAKDRDNNAVIHRELSYELRSLDQFLLACEERNLTLGLGFFTLWLDTMCQVHAWQG